MIEKEEVQAMLPTYAEALARELDARGHSTTLDRRNPSCIRVDIGEEFGLYVRYGWPYQKMEVSCSVPHHSDIYLGSRDVLPTPGFTAGRDAGKVATEVMRKCYEAYAAFWEASRDRIAEHWRQVAERNDLVTRLQNIEGLQVHRIGHLKDHFSLQVLGDFDNSLSIQLYSTGGVRIERGHLKSYDQLEELMEYWVRLEQERRPINEQAA